MHGFAPLDCQTTRCAGPAFLSAEGVDSGAGYVASLKSRHRRHWLRKERNLLAVCDLTHVTGADEAEACLPMVHEILAHSWKDTDRMRRIGVQLYTEQIRGTAQDGTLSLRLAYLEGRPVAFTMMLMDPGGGAHHGYFTAYHADHARLGAGAVLVFTAVRNSFDNGASRFELWAKEGALSQLANCRLQTYALSIRRKGLLPRLCLNAAVRIGSAKTLLRQNKLRPRS